LAALVEVLSVFATESRAPIKEHVDKLFIAVLKTLRAGNGPPKGVILKSATDAVLFFSIENYREEVVVREFGQVEN
jgi:hypothetical protein